MAYTYEHPRPSVTVDSIVLNYQAAQLKILLVKRKNDPYKDHWALPGGFLDMEETPEDAVKRELKEETGLEIDDVKQIGAFGNPERDPRGRVISISFLTLLKGNKSEIKAASDASEVKWFVIHDLPGKLAFDHREIIDDAVHYLKSGLKLAMIDHLPYFNLELDEIQEINKLITQ